MEKFKKWCAADTASGRFSRTVAQGVVSALITYLPDMLAGCEVIPAEYKPLVIALLMAVLAPAQHALGCSDPECEECK